MYSGNSGPRPDGRWSVGRSGRCSQGVLLLGFGGRRWGRGGGVEVGVVHYVCTSTAPTRMCVFVFLNTALNTWFMAATWMPRPSHDSEEWSLK